MTVLSSAQINNPAANTLKMLSAVADAAAFVATIQADPQFFTNLGKQLTALYALTQPEMDERDAAAKTVSDAQGAVTAAQQQLVAVQAQIAAAKTQSDAAIKAAKDASDAYIKGQNQVISDRWAALDVYKDELNNRKLELDEQEETNTAAAKKNTADAAANAAKQTALTNFANALRAFAPNVPVLESTDSTE